MSPAAAKAAKNTDFKPETALSNPRPHPLATRGQGFEGVQPRTTGHEPPRLRLVTTSPDEPATTPPVAPSSATRPTPPSPSKPPRRGTIPTYRQRPGYDQAIVTLTGSRTGKRRDYWLGEFNTPQSREMYFRVIAEWEGMGRQLPDMQPVGDQGGGGKSQLASEQLLIAHIICDYWKHIKQSHRNHISDLIRMSR